LVGILSKRDEYKVNDNAFSTLDSALEFVELLRSETERTQREIESLIEEPNPSARQIEALRLVSYKLSRLHEHMEASGRLLKDLRSLRNILLRESWNRKCRQETFV
jgi:hypothetical protein